jgi:hypothetical protein
MDVGGHCHAPATFPPGKETRYPFCRRLNAPPPVPIMTDAEYLAPPEFHPTTLQSVACRYTDYAIPEKQILA